MMIFDIDELCPRLPAMPVQNLEFQVNYNPRQPKRKEKVHHVMGLTSQQGLQDVGPTLCDTCSDKHLTHQCLEPVASRRFRC